MESADKEPSSTMLYVSNLPFSFENDNLKDLFKDYEVVSAYVAQRRNGRSKGFGFVTFGSSEQQKKALEALDGRDLEGRALTVRIAHKDDRRDSKGELKEEFKTQEPRQPRKAGGAGKAAADKTPSETVLYVSNLPFEFSDEDLSKVFAAHAPVSARIARRRNERSKGFGFVEFAKHEDQQAALALDGHKLEEREISVKVSMVGADKGEGGAAAAGDKKKKPTKPKKAASDREGSSSNTLYVSNLPFDLTDDLLADIFKAKGHNPKSARIARRRDDRSKGFGFVEFASQDEQLAALKAVDQTELGDRTITCKVAINDSNESRAEGGNNNNDDGAREGGKRRRNRRKAGEDRPAPKEKKDSERLVYVSNLSFDVDDNALAKLFDGLSIKSAHVAVRHNGKSKGFGFVEFESQADQQAALKKNGVEVEGRTLTVEVAKEVVADE